MVSRTAPAAGSPCRRPAVVRGPLVAAADAAYTHAMGIAMAVAAGVALVTAAVALRRLPGLRARARAGSAISAAGA